MSSKDDQLKAKAAAFLREAQNGTKLKEASADELQHLEMAIKIHGGDFDIWRESVQLAELERTKSNSYTIELDKVVSYYNVECDSRLRTECAKCEKSGFLLCVVIQGIHYGTEKSYIYNRNDLRHSAFLKGMAAAGSPFQGIARFLPCTCENGTKQNFKNHKSSDWLTRQQRVQVSTRFYPASEEQGFYISEDLEYINAIATGQNYAPVSFEEQYQKLTVKPGKVIQAAHYV